MKLSSIQSSDEAGVSHNANIRKHVFIANGDINHITNLSRAVFPAGEIAKQHQHMDMTEVFYIESGIGEIVVDGKKTVLQQGMCITIDPHEQHELRNNGPTELVVLCLGIKTS